MKYAAITGPNQSGKTTFARMIGRIFYLYALGLPVPCEAAGLCFFDGIFSHFTREENVSNNLGRLKDEAIRVKDIYNHMEGKNLLIFDGLFSGTTLYDAMAIYKKLLHYLDTKECFVLCVTSLPAFSTVNPHIIGYLVNPFYRAARESAEKPNYTSRFLEQFRLDYISLMERLP